MRSLLVLAIVCLSLMAGCEKSQSPTGPAAEPTPAKPFVPAPISAAPLLNAPLEPTVVEMANGALPVWRKYAPSRPLLVLLANEPDLQNIPKEKSKVAQALLADADDQELVRQTDFLNPNPVFLPSMSLTAALDAGYFSGVLWVFPAKVAVETLSLDAFRNQLIEAGLASRSEVDGFTLEGGVFSGTIHNLPFRAAHPLALPRVEEPTLLHLDVSYFKPLYKGEIKTPLYPLIVQTLASLKEQQWKVAAATITRSNLDGSSPLTGRFLADDIAAILRTPQLLTEPMPFQWELRGQALYLTNFLQSDKIRQLYLDMEKAAPQDASVKYSLYHFARDNSEPNVALDYLRQAVQLDRVYGFEYMALADLAMSKNRPEKAIDMLNLARQALPEDPLIPVELTRTYLNQGKFDAARSMLADLKKITWSPSYYRDMIKTVESWEEHLGGN